MYNGFGYNKRSNSINKDPKNFKELSCLYGNPYSYALPYTKRGLSSYKSSRLSAII